MCSGVSGRRSMNTRDNVPPTGRATATVKVLIYLLDDDHAMACVMESQWKGMFRLDRRLSKTLPIHERTPAPHGVPPHVWDAYQFLGQVVWNHVDEQRGKGAR
jgi:hypothetical protein